jgi:teichuronic acid biosynthesis glycosyltransferase TuaC
MHAARETLPTLKDYLNAREVEVHTAEYLSAKPDGTRKLEKAGIACARVARSRADFEGQEEALTGASLKSSCDLESGGRLRVLVLSRAYPNNVVELMGLWVERLVRHSKSFCEPVVVSPVAYCPPLLGIPENFARFRRVDRYREHDGIGVFHPRMLAGPGYSLYNFEGKLYYAAVKNLIDRLWRESKFDLIHAHFTYPDGVVAAQLGRRYGVPVVITEHVPWDVWGSYPKVREQAIWALGESAYHISVSRPARSSVERYAGPRQNLIVIPNGVDGTVFRLSSDEHGRVPNRILFVGAVRPVKGVDILLRSIRLLRDRGREASLIVAGEPFFGSYQKEETRLRYMTRDLQLQDWVHFIGKQSPSEVAALMARSGVVVLPSRAESFGSVLIEALACGTPVVATRCGGPEDIVNEQVGVLVRPEDPEALAKGIEHVLDHQTDYDPAKLRAYALENFGLERVGRRLAHVYENAVRQFQGDSAAAAPHPMGDLIAG